MQLGEKLTKENKQSFIAESPSIVEGKVSESTYLVYVHINIWDMVYIIDTYTPLLCFDYKSNWRSFCAVIQ